MDLTRDNIDHLAKNLNLTVGKWLIYRPPSQIDEVWLKIANAIIHGQLGPEISTKVSTTPNKGKHVICVYTKDYFDDGEVMTVRDRLSL